jgi:apolipoprotein N-acyltransferase
VLYFSLFPALFGYLLARLGGTGTRWGLLVAAPALWVAIEWLRGWLLTGFPWLQLGYSQVDAPLAGLAPWLGVLGVSWGAALSAALLVALASSTAPARRLAGLALVVLWAGAWALGQVPWTIPVGQPLRALLVQGNIPQDQKWLAERKQATLERYRDLSRVGGAELVIWPETAVPALYHRARDFLEAVAAELQEQGAHLLAGVPVKDLESGRYHNSVVAMADSPVFYHKRHLVPFGEYLPLPGLLGWVVQVMQIPMSDFSPGPAQPTLLPAAGQLLGVSVCYEDAFGAEVIDTLPQATLLVNVSNDAWFGDSIAPAQHLQIARMRSQESGRDLLRATNTGISAFIDSRGRITRQAPQFQAVALSGEVQGRAGATPYVRLGNWPVLCGLGISLLSRRLRRRRG